MEEALQAVPLAEEVECRANPWVEEGVHQLLVHQGGALVAEGVLQVVPLVEEVEYPEFQVVAVVFLEAHSAEQVFLVEDLAVEGVLQEVVQVVVEELQL